MGPLLLPRLSALTQRLLAPALPLSHPLYRWTRPRGSRRGIALLMAITCIVFLTVLVSEINYGARVRLLKSAHHRDQEIAYQLARTGINLYRLVLVSSRQMGKNATIRSFAQLMGVAPEDLLWTMLPSLNTSLLRLMFVSNGSLSSDEVEDFQAEGLTEAQREESRGGGRFADKNFLDFDGDFTVSVVDEDSRVNLNQLRSADLTAETLNPFVLIFQRGLMSGEVEDQWYYDRQLDRNELIFNLVDWVDSDNTRDLLGGYEDDLYNRRDDPYLAKNANFETLEEVRLVAGWEGEVFDRLKERITVYGSGKININTASDEMLIALLRAYTQPFLFSDDQAQVVLQTFRDNGGCGASNTQSGGIALVGVPMACTSAKQFTQALEQLGRTVDPALAQVVDVGSEVFRLTSMGEVGDTRVTITAVIDFSSDEAMRTGGTVLYWRVD